MSLGSFFVLINFSFDSKLSSENIFIPLPRMKGSMFKIISFTKLALMKDELL